MFFFVSVQGEKRHHSCCAAKKMGSRTPSLAWGPCAGLRAGVVGEGDQTETTRRTGKQAAYPSNRIHDDCAIHYRTSSRWAHERSVAPAGRRFTEALGILLAEQTPNQTTGKMSAAKSESREKGEYTAEFCRHTRGCIDAAAPHLGVGGSSPVGKNSRGDCHYWDYGELSGGRAAEAVAPPTTRTC